MQYKLIRYGEINEEQYIDYISEWEKTGELIVPGATNRKGGSFEQLREKWKMQESDEAYKNGWVPATLYFLMDETGYIIGAIHFRHELNERLSQNGGHIGYGIRPSERRKGYGVMMLGMMLRIIKKMNYHKVLLTCDEDNPGSARTIEKNGGILDKKIIFEGVWTRQYWIDL